MPMVPYDPVPSTLPSGRIDSQASPDDFGSQIGTAISQVGQSINQAGQQALQIATQRQQTANALDADNAMTGFQTASNKLLFGDPSDPSAPPGFYSLRGQAAVNAGPAVTQQLEALRQQAGQGLNAPIVQKQFDQESRRYQTGMLTQVSQHMVQAGQQFADDTSDAQIQGAHDTAVLQWNNPGEAAKSVSDGTMAIIAKGERLGLPQGTIQQDVANYRSNVTADSVRAQAVTDPIGANHTMLANFSSLTPQDYVALGRTLRPQVYADASKADATNITSGTQTAMVSNVATEAAAQGVDPTLAVTTAKLESNLGGAQDRPNSQYRGVYQMGPNEWAAGGGTDANRDDLGAQIHIGVGALKGAQSAADAAVGGTAQPWQTYLCHQQGTGGGAALLKADPSTNAVDALAGAYGGNRSAATNAIVANGGTPNMTAGDFCTMWQGRYEQASSSVTVPKVGPGGLPMAPVDQGGGDASVPASGAAGAVPGAAPGTPDAHPDIGQPAIPPGGPVPAAAQPNAMAAIGPQPAAPVQAPVGQPDEATAIAAAQSATDPYGGHDPDYQALLVQRVQEHYALQRSIQAQVQLTSSHTLLAAAIGTAQTMLPGQAPGATAAKPTNLDELLAAPGVRQAWMQATPETQRTVLDVLTSNAKGSDPPLNANSLGIYTRLLGMSVSDPDGFQKINMADPALVAALPQAQLLKLIGEQHDNAVNTAKQSSRNLDVLHAQDVLKPDMLAAGIVEDPARPGNAANQNYAGFTGKLTQAMQQFQTVNNRKPTDPEVMKMGETLLTPGTVAGTGSWFSSPTSTRMFQVSDPSKFQPTVPDADKQGIIAAWRSRNGGAVPDDATVSRIWMTAKGAQQ